MNKSVILVMACLMVLSCRQAPQRNPQTESSVQVVSSQNVLSRSVYHWKTSFDLSPEDTMFIREHGIQKIYLRMFDVGMDTDNGRETGEIVPLGTTRFFSRIPQGCSYVPTVYITLKVLPPQLPQPRVREGASLKLYRSPIPPCAEGVLTRIRQVFIRAANSFSFSFWVMGFR